MEYKIQLPPGLGLPPPFNQSSYPSTSSTILNSTIQFYDTKGKGKRYEDDDDGEAESLRRARRALWNDDEPLILEKTPNKIPIEGDSPGLDEEEEEDLDNLDPCTSQPLHSILSPLPSCLRPPLARSSTNLLALPISTPLSTSLTADSSSETSSSETETTSLSSISSQPSSVHFSDIPPTIGMTWSALDYQRKGQEYPITKLSLKERVELRDVRAAVGVYSGKVSKWLENDLAREERNGTEEEEKEGIKCSFSKVITLQGGEIAGGCGR